MIEQSSDSMSPDPKDFMDALMVAAAVQSDAGPTFQDIVDAHPEVVARLSKLDPAQSATILGSLLILPDVQANCFRIETLVHLALMVAKGRGRLSDQQVRALFQAMGNGFCGRM